MKSKNVIEINGNLYDAKTGKPLHTKSTSVKKSPPSAHQTHATRPKSVDGFGRTKSTQKSSPKPGNTHAQPAKTHPKVTRATPQHAKLSVKRSVTLHRRAVTAPSIISEPSSQPEVTSTALNNLDSKRFKRAASISRSSAIQRFLPQAAPLEVQSTSEESQPLTKHIEKTHQQKHSADAPVKNDSGTKEKLIKKAMATAAIKNTPQHTKHHQTKKAPLGRYVTSGLVVLLLVGYVAYLNVPSISMKVAAHRAGFAATMPGYRPAGYSLKGPIAYSPGQVTVNFHSNTDSREFSLKQQPTTWDSTALLENYVTKQNSNYLTYQDRGLTIYIYNGSNAAWVNGGKLYQLEGDNSQLNTDQLLKLATSV